MRTIQTMELGALQFLDAVYLQDDRFSFISIECEASLRIHRLPPHTGGLIDLDRSEVWITSARDPYSTEALYERVL